MRAIDVIHKMSLAEVAGAISDLDVHTARVFMSTWSACLVGSTIELPDCARKRILNELAAKLQEVLADEKLWEGVQK